ncbi:calcium-binding protein [Ralstonia nicotianae]|uniref:calcium-binding protein n=1 Tax=Ralstonia pseudosolanacearum TaxID=1310165 RepID=UPI000E5933E8
MERNRWGYSDPCYVYKFDGIQQYANTNVQLNPGDQSNWTDAYRNMVGIVDILEKFNGQLLYDPASTGALWGHNRAFLSYNPGGEAGDGKSASIFVSPTYSIDVSASQVSALVQGYQALERSVYQGLVLQTRLMPYLNAIGLNVDSKGATGIRVDFSKFNNLLDGKFSTDPVNAMVDLAELTASGSSLLSAVGYDPTARLKQWAMQLQSSGQWQNFLGQFSDGIEADYSNGVFNMLSSAGNGIFLTSADSSTVQDNNGSSILIATTGNDTLISGKGNDTLVAGIGYTYMAGRSGADTYVFERGDGIAEMETSGGQNNVLQLTNYNRSDLVLRQDGNTMVLDFGNGDVVRLHDYFLRQQVWGGDVGMRSVQFADGTQMSIAELAASANTVHGNGDGTFSGGWGNNILIGGAGNETLVGGNGNSTLVAGGGNDTMVGSTSGSNLYEIQASAASDTVVNRTGGTANSSTLQFDGANSDQLWFQHVGNDLLVSVIGTSTQVSISGWYTATSNHVQQITAADGKTLADGQVDALVQAMASFHPPSAGTMTLPPDYEAQLQPTLSANWR